MEKESVECGANWSINTESWHKKWKSTNKNLYYIRIFVRSLQTFFRAIAIFFALNYKKVIMHKIGGRVLWWFSVNKTLLLGPTGMFSIQSPYCALSTPSRMKLIVFTTRGTNSSSPASACRRLCQSCTSANISLLLLQLHPKSLGIYPDQISHQCPP